ncbi:MAG: Dihydrolipoyl dehydrogenase [Calditrichaeota bacterium]|nr:Dihydrolipoyl dehydrogenase [Calditrichota bacterium]
MESFDYTVIGSGPAGYVSAIRAAQLGMKTALVEKYPTLGGTCLNVGCIPSKAMLESSHHYHELKHKFEREGIIAKDVRLDLKRMHANKRDAVNKLTEGVALLMKKNKITVFEGRGRLKGAHELVVEGGDGNKTAIESKTIVLAMGSKPVALPFLSFDGERVIDSTRALALEKVPKSMVVIGAGAVGLEMGSVWSRLGANVTVVEMLPQITPFADRNMAKALQRALAEQGIEFTLDTKVKSAKVQKSQVKMEYETGAGESGELKAEVVLVAVGRKPYTEDCGLEDAGVEMDGPRVRVDDRFRTNVEGVYAIGDLIRGPMLAHKGEDEGIAVAEIAAGQPGHVNYDSIPNVVYTWPELAQVGITESEAKERGLKVNTGRFLYRANGRALTMNEPDGQVKIIADASSERILGAAIVGARASDMIAELALAIEFKASWEDVAYTSHAHPTLAEIIREAAFAVDKRPIHG